MIFLRRIFLPLLAVSALAGCSLRSPSTSFVPTPSEAKVAELIIARLEVSRQVAWQKYLDSLPVRDPRRESAMLASLVEDGGRRGLSGREVEKFFGPQIVASRRLQSGLIHGWKRGAPLPPLLSQSLTRDLRPRLDEINRQLLDELAPFRPGFRRYLYGSLRVHGFPWLVARAAAAGVAP